MSNSSEIFEDNQKSVQLFKYELTRIQHESISRQGK